MRKLHFEPNGGLANRIRALDAALHLAEAQNAQIELHWQNDSGFTGRLERYVVKPPAIARIRVWNRTRAWFRPINKAYREHLARDRARRGVPTYTDRHFARLARDPAAWPAILAHPEIYVSSCDRFYPVATPYRSLEFAPRLVDRVAEIRAGWSRPMVGVHIRRRDNAYSIELSKTEYFVGRLSQLVDEIPEVGFFLATDEPAEERQLRDAFGDRISVHPKASVKRDEPDALDDAVIDFMCLGLTERIVGSAASSFSEEAARWGGAPIEYATAPRNGASASPASAPSATPASATAQRLRAAG